jgi:hypothetical protein
VSFTLVPVLRMLSALRAGFHANFLLAEIALEFLGDIFVFHRHDARQHLDDRHFGAEAVENRREFHAHRARADDRQALGNGGEVEDFDVGEDELGVGLEAGKHAGFRAGGDDDVLGFEGLHAGIGLHFHFAAALERGVAADALHFGALEQQFHALGMLGDDAVLAVFDLGVIQARDSRTGCPPGRHARSAARHRQSAAGTWWGCSPPKGRCRPAWPVSRRGCFQSVLAGAYGCGVAAGTTPDHDEVVRHFFHSTYVTG